MTGTLATVLDLADLVHAHMAEIALDDAMAGFTVHRSSEDGSAVVAFRPGVLDAYVGVLRWQLTGWTAQLRDAGFTVHVETRDDRGETAVPQWLRITGWQQPESDAAT